MTDAFLVHAGEFVKYHDLKEKDVLILYQAGEGKLVSLSTPLTASVLV